VTLLPFESSRVKSGAFCPTCGAPFEGGRRLVATVTAKTKKAKTAMPRKAATPL
jgi:hypothetical protein